MAAADQQPYRAGAAERMPSLLHGAARPAAHGPDAHGPDASEPVPSAPSAGNAPEPVPTAPSADDAPAADRPDAQDALARTLTIAVLHYQTPDLLDECLARVLEAAPDVRTVVVDAGDARPLPAEWAQRSPAAGAGVELVHIANRSYAHAVNAALRLADTDYLAFMNADVYVRPETFANLVYALRAPHVAAVGPLVRDGAGRLQDQGLPYRRHQRRAIRGAFAVDVPWLSGCMQVVRVAAARGTPVRRDESRLASVGGMDETFRFYNEDVEWGARLARAGWTNRLVATPVVHLGGSATPTGDGAFFVEGLRGGYVFSRRYRPPWFRAAHRRAVMLWAAVMERFGPAHRRTTFREVRCMFARGRWEHSPFGATLADRAPPGATGADRAPAGACEDR